MADAMDNRAMAYQIDRDSLVFVVGAGIMGAGIAQVAAQAGHTVRLFDARDGAAAASDPFASRREHLERWSDAGRHVRQHRRGGQRLHHRRHSRPLHVPRIRAPRGDGCRRCVACSIRARGLSESPTVDFSARCFSPASSRRVWRWRSTSTA